MKKIYLLILFTFSLPLFTGCATITGTATGAATGAVDAPAQTYRENRDSFEKYPILHSVNVVGMGTVGVLAGPVLGFGKGLSLDVQWLIGQQQYPIMFGTYEPQSIWRPFTLQWEQTR